MCPSFPFNPSAATHLALLNDWMDGTLSLRNLADRYQTTPAELLFFFSQPEITAQLSLLHSAAISRVRLAATTHLDSAIAALALIVKRFLHEQANPDPTLTPDQQRRAEDLGRRAATVLLRFIKNKPAPLTCSHQTSPASAGEVSQQGPRDAPRLRQRTRTQRRHRTNGSPVRAHRQRSAYAPPTHSHLNHRTGPSRPRSPRHRAPRSLHTRTQPNPPTLSDPQSAIRNPQSAIAEHPGLPQLPPPRSPTRSPAF